MLDIVKDKSFSKDSPCKEGNEDDLMLVIDEVLGMMSIPNDGSFLTGLPDEKAQETVSENLHCELV